MAQDDYDKIKQWAKDKKAMSAKYKGELRKLWPFVIGTSPKPNTDPSQDEQIVLCYQFESPHSGTGWRCFKVDSLKTPTEIPATGRPRDLKPKELDRQSCVQDRDYPP